jgi:hypothetical protein
VEATYWPLVHEQGQPLLVQLVHHQLVLALVHLALVQLQWVRLVRLVQLV